MAALIDGINAIAGRPAGWKLDPITGEYSLAFDFVDPDSRAKKRRKVRAVESVASSVKLSAADHRKQAAGFFGQQQGLDAMVAGSKRGQQIQRQAAESRILTTLAANLEAVRTQGCRTLVSTDIVRHNNKPCFLVTCPCSGDAYVSAWDWARGIGPKCQKAAWVAQNGRKLHRDSSPRTPTGGAS